MEIASYGTIPDSEICRTCLLELSDDSKIFYLDSIISSVDKTTIRHKLRDCIPELDLNITPNAAVCFECLSLINSSYSFKNKCLQTEKNIKKYARRSGSIFVDLAELVEQNKKSHQYQDIDPLEIKQEPGLAESHTYTRFFVKQEPLDTSNDKDDFYQDNSLDRNHLFDYTLKTNQQSIQHESLVTPKQKVKPSINKIVNNVVLRYEPIQQPKSVSPLSKFNVVLPPNKQQKPLSLQSNPPPLKKIKVFKPVSSPTPSVKNIQADVTERLLGNCAISLKQIPKNNIVLSGTKVSVKPIDNKTEPKPIKPKLLNNGEIKKDESQEIKLETKPSISKIAASGNQATQRPQLQRSTTQDKLRAKVTTADKPQPQISKLDKQPQDTNEKSLEKIKTIQMKSEPKNLVYAILTLVKPNSRSATPEPTVQTKLIVPDLDPKEITVPVTIKSEPLPEKSDNNKVSDIKPTTSTAPVEEPTVLPLSPPPLVQISEPTKPVKIEPKLTSVESTPTSQETIENSAAELGYNINISDIPPLVPIQPDTSTDFDDGITHVECTPNIDDYVNEELDEDDSIHKCNDCEFECKGKSEFILHLSTHLEEKFGVKPEPLTKKRDLFGRTKTLGGKLVYECQICNYRTALKRRYMFHTKLHEENKLLKCTQCDYLCATKSNLNVHMAVHTGHKPHKCTECGYGTVSKSALIVHMRIHTGDRPYSCGVCGYCTISKSALIVHNRIHTGSKPYRCPTCNYRTITKSALTVHMRTHTGDKPFKCHLCDYSTRAKSALNVHVRIHEGYKPYQCTECEYRCSQRSGLNVHMRIHTGDKPFQCTECDYKCSNKSSLVVHHRTHTGETPYKCSECDYTTAWKSALNVHTRIHGDRKPYRCTECPYKCAQRSTLNVHMRIHTGDKPYQCLECDYRCRYQGNLKMHMRVHTRETPFKCSMCDYCTTAKSALIVHIRIHTGEKPFKCTECSYKCSTKSSLKIHSRIHTGETPYECKRCLYKASSNSALKVHLRIHTGEKPFKCSYCSYRASNKGSIKVHLRVHTGETPYACSICEYKTTAKSALIVHMRIHTGDKPYKCEECSYRCNNKSSLKVHLNVHKGRTPYKCEICDYRCKKKFVLKRHLRVHREEQLGNKELDNLENETSCSSTPDNLIMVKNELDESMVMSEPNESIHEEDEANNLINSGYEGDMEISNIQPEFSVIAV